MVVTRIDNINYVKEKGPLKEPKRICIIIKSLANGGAEKQSILLAKALKEHYPVHYVILNDQPQHHAHLTNLATYGIDHTYLQGSTFAKMKKFIQLLRTKKINLLFTFLPGDTLFASIAGRIVGVEHIFGGLRNALIPERRKLFGLKMVHNYLVDATISNSYTGKRYLKEKGFKDEKTLVIHNGLIIDTEYLQRTEPKVITILSVGRFVPQKDYETAIKAIVLLKKSAEIQKDFRYIIIGEGQQEQQVRQWIKEYDCEDLIEMVIDTDKIPEYYQKSDIYLCSSLFEGLSNTLIEASSFSLPIVATDAGDNNQLVLDGQNGYITPIGDAQQLAVKLIPLIKSHDQRMKMGKRSYEHLVESFSYEKFTQRYLELVNNLKSKKTVS